MQVSNITNNTTISFVIDRFTIHKKYENDIVIYSHIMIYDKNKYMYNTLTFNHDLPNFKSKEEVENYLLLQ